MPTYTPTGGAIIPSSTAVYDPVSGAGATPNAPKPVSVGVVSSEQGLEAKQQADQKLAKLSPPPAQPVTEAKTDTATKTAPATDAAQPDNTITLLNPTTEQSLSFQNPDINKENIQAYLGAGYQLAEAKGNIPSWLTPNGVSTAQSPVEKAQAAADTAATDLKNLSDTLTKQTVSDADLQQQVQGIASLWDARIADMQKVNASREANINTTGVRLGSQYAGGAGGQFGGIVSEEERQGLTRISELEGQKQSAIAAAKTAALQQNWQVYSKQIDIAEKAYSDKVTEVKNLQDAALAHNKLISDQIQKQKDDYYTQVTKPIQDVASEAAKYGAPAGVLEKINASTSHGEAIQAAGQYLQDPTSNGGMYNAYVAKAQAAGLTPMSAEDFLLRNKTNEAYATQAAKNQSDAAFTGSDKNQQKLEEQYRQVLGKEFSARTGALGVENAKVNQANHLNSLFTQYYDPKTGNYNIPTAQYAELAIGLANMISPSGQSSDSDRAEIKSKTLGGDLKGALQYVTGQPMNGNTQAIIKNLVDSVDRQAQTAVRNREVALQNMRDQAPTDLKQERIDALNRSTHMVGYEGQARLSKDTVNNYVKAHPAEAASIATLYKVPGATDQDIEEYLKAQGKIQ